MESIRIFSPATVANVGCGFDVLGFCLDHVGDEMTITKIPDKTIRISGVEGYDLPTEVKSNVAGISALAMYDELNLDHGFEIYIKKGIMPGSGIGSSAASAVGSVFGMNELIQRPFSKHDLLRFAVEGESFASQAKHADNLAPALLGGFTLVRDLDPIDVLQIPSPKDLYAVIIHPKIEIKTSDARSVLPAEIELPKAIRQWANVGALVHGLHTSDYDLIKRSLEDVVIEPHRKSLIPLYEDAKLKAMEAGALGCNISGSGPSIFALCQGEVNAQAIEKVWQELYENSGIAFETFYSQAGAQGARIIL